MKALAVLTLLAACHGGKGASAPAPKGTPYLILFHQGATWTLSGTPSPVTCKVAETKPIGDSIVARLDCGALLVSGTWVSTPAGLYHPYLPVDEPDELALLGENDLLIAKNPAERAHSHALDGGAQDSIEAFTFDGSWCVRQTTQSPTDRRAYALCVDGNAITGGSEDVSSEGEHHRSTFGKAPPEAAEADQEVE